MIHRFENIASTNDEARRLSRAGAEAFTVVVADSQQAGRGRNGRLWVSPAGVGLYASVVLRPHVATEFLPSVTLLAGVAAAEAVMGCSGLPIMIKWPNDLLIYDRKVAGLLCEAELSASGDSVVIVGLGVNVNTSEALLPARTRFPATSLLIESGKHSDHEALLDAWIGRLRAWMTIFETQGVEPILAAWRQRDALTDRKLHVVLPNGEGLRGVGAGVAGDGSLLVKMDDGAVQSVIAGEVSLG